MTQAAWYTFPRIDNFGTIDPQGPFWKPDSNIQLPPNYPVTALLPGTVTSVQRASWDRGFADVTIRLDHPVNSEATHTFYIHMGNATVAPGQHVNAGDLIGYNNNGSGAPLGFGLYNGDVYGSGSAWNQLQADLKPGGPGLLNPVALLDKAKAGGGVTNYTSNGTSTGGTGSTSGTSGSGPNLQGFAVSAGVFVIALVLVGFGAYMTFRPQVDSAIAKAKGVAVKAAEGAA